MSLLVDFDYESLKMMTVEDLVILSRMKDKQWLTAIVYDCLDFQTMLDLTTCKSPTPLSKRVELRIKNGH